MLQFQQRNGNRWSAHKHHKQSRLVSHESNHMTTLTQLLTIAGSRWVETGWDAPKNRCIDDIIERFDDEPTSLLDFQHSDWVNLCECYTYQALERWNKQERDIMALFDDYAEAIGATSTAQALEGEIDGFYDGDHMNAAIVNHAMTWGANELLRDIASFAYENSNTHCGPLWDSFAAAA